ncbi:MAG: hypothetical protein K1X94_04290 [Sandaracinaceae bacterium]|nr:hypothetical protein [Sandaracinaceae bacterium]
MHHRLALALAPVLVAASACGGTTYVQPPRPVEQAAGPVLPLRAMTLAFDRGTATIDASGVMSFDGNVVGTFAEAGTFTLPDGNVWATMANDGGILVNVDDPASAGPTTMRYTTEGNRLVRPDGQVLATLDASGQLVTSSGSFVVTGITSRASRLALFLYLVAATYAEGAAVPASE